MKAIRTVGSIVFVMGLFTMVFAGLPWHVMVAEDPVVPSWLRIAVFCFLGGILVVLATVALEQGKYKQSKEPPPPAAPATVESEGQSREPDRPVLLLNFMDVPGREVTEILGLAQGHTVFAVWLGRDLSALVRLIVGGELTEYTEMMGQARETATNRMIAQAAEMGADAVINVRYMTTSVVGTASELMAYGTAVKLSA